MNYKQAPVAAGVVDKGFPNCGRTRSGVAVIALMNTTLRGCGLARVAKDCSSELENRGRIDGRVQRTQGGDSGSVN